MFLTVRETAKQLGISTTSLRRLVHAGQCPGYYSGSRFYVCVEQLKEKLSGVPQ